MSSNVSFSKIIIFSIWKQTDLCKELAEVFPNLTINLKTVPSPYIPEIYTWLLNRQKSAKQIYMEMLNEKIEYLQKQLKLSKGEAQAAVLKISGFSTWKDVEQIDEAQARYLINLEKDKIKTAETFGYDYIIYEFDKSDV